MKDYRFEAPRPEAEPLPPDELTEDQKLAGKHLASLLREIATGRTAPVSSSRHSYLPRLDYGRQNHVLLIDGKRGAGKSSLLLTLLAEYEQFLDQPMASPKPGWANREDYIIPVGIVDLDPLSPATNLLFYILSHLERVVAAIEESHRPEIAEPGTTYQRAKVIELNSRLRWRELARRIAASWDGNINERKGMLDLKDFVLERQEDEFHRLNLSRSFTAFVDALAIDYQRWSPLPDKADRLPFFLIAIDDADMNNDKSAELLEIVRKFWHRRLGYLLTGDSDLFRDRIRQSIGRSVSASMRASLVDEVYDKAIPKKHRGQLGALTPAERLTRGPNLHRIFTDLHLNGSAQTTLAAYFNLNEQACNLLPDRPRALYELAASLNDEADFTQDRGYAQADRLVHNLWMNATSSLSADIKGRLQKLFQLDPQSGRLRLGPGSATISPEWKEYDSRECAPSLVLRIGIPHLFEAQMHWSTSLSSEQYELSAASPTMAGLMLGVDSINPATTPQSTSLAPTGLETQTFAQTEWSHEFDSPIIFPWPYPDWRSYAETLRFSKRWSLVLNRRPRTWTVEQLAFSFLEAIVSHCLARPSQDSDSHQDWPKLARDIFLLAQERQSKDRWKRINAEWALGRAGLLAAPESGLSQEIANQFLLSLKTSFGNEYWEDARKLLKSERDTRARLPQGPSELSGAYADLYRRIDEKFLGHRFREMTEDTDSNISGPRLGIINGLVGRLDLELPFGTRLWAKDQRGSTLLDHYFWDLRKELLAQAPQRLVEQVHRELANYNRISGVTPDALHRFWIILSESYQRHDLAGAVHLSDGQLRIDYSLLQRLTTRSFSAGRIPLSSLKGANDLSFHVFTTSGTTFPLLESNLPRPLDALFRVVFDYVADQEDKRIADIHWLDRGWHGCEVELPGGQYARTWPVARWRTLIEAEMLERSWNEVTQLVASISHGATSGSKPRYLEALAYWFINANLLLTERRASPGQHTSVDLKAEQWHNLLGRCVKLRDQFREKGQSGRPGVYNRWFDRLHLMATPEAGLSWDTSKIILDRVASNISPIQAQHERAALLAASGAKHIQRRLDAEFADHPWVKLMS